MLLRVASGYDVSMIAIPSIYRLLKFGNARHILYLTGEASDQGENVLGQRVAYVREQFARYIVPDEGRSLRRIYTIEGLSMLPLDAETHIFIATMPQLAALLNATPGQVAYRKDLTIEAFDMIFVDDARLCVKPEYRGLSSYFDAPLVGFVAEEEAEVLSFFGGRTVYTLQTTLRPATVFIPFVDKLVNEHSIAILQKALFLRGVLVLFDISPLSGKVLSREAITQLIEKSDIILLYYGPIVLPFRDHDPLKILESRYPEINSALLTAIDRFKATYGHSKRDEIYLIIFSLHNISPETISLIPAGASVQTIAREITSGAISTRQSMLSPKPTNEIGIHFRTFPPTPPVGEHALDIDWSAYCADRWPTTDEWRQDLLAALEDAKDVLKAQSLTTLRCYINARMSAAFLFGLVFSRQAGFTLLLVEQSNTWSTNATLINAPLINTELEERQIAVAESNQIGEDTDAEAELSATVEISISNSVTADATSYLETQALDCRYRLHIRLHAEAGERPLEGANEALTLAWQVRRAVENLCKSTAVTHLHLFCSLRHRLAVLLGHFLHGLDVTITFYDFDTTNRRYLPMYTLDAGGGRF